MMMMMIKIVIFICIINAATDVNRKEKGEGKKR